MSDRVGASKAKSWSIERRKGARYKLDWPTRVLVRDPMLAAFEEVAVLRDLSSSGAFAHLQNPPRLGARVLVAIRLPVTKETWMMYAARVVRLEPGEIGVGVAVRFDTSRPKFSKRLDLKSFREI